MLSIRRWSHFFALLLLSMLVLALPVRAAGMAEFTIRPATKMLPIEGGVELLVEEPGENLTPERVMQADMAARWSIYPRKKINLPGQRKPVWIRVALRNAAPQNEWIFGIDWPLLDDVQFHQFDPDAQVWTTRLQGGLSKPEALKAYKDPTPNFPIEIEPGKRAVLVMRLQTNSSFAAPMQLWELQAWRAERYDYGVVMGLLFGILGVMFCYNLSLFIFTRESSFRTYSGYLLSIIAYELCATGFGPLYVWPGNHWLNQRGYEFFAACSFLAATVFFRRFLKLGRAAPHLNRMNQGFIVLFTALAVVTIFPSAVAVTLTLALGGFVVGFVGVYTAGYLAWKGNVLARYFVIAWAAIIGATFLLFLAMAGVIDGGGWIKYAQPVGFVVETVLLSVALAARIKYERASKEAAQRESLLLTRKVEHEREEKLRAQEHALAVQLRANEELELRVLDRTAELKRAMENIELANIELSKLSVTDSLTKVHNRRYFDETLKKEHDRSARTGAPVALILADIDHFKKINDSVGHLAGDECLKLVAAALAGTVGRSTDMVARYGGEEFAIVLPATDAAHALEVAERMRLSVEGIQFIYRGKRVPMSISLGVVARVAQPNQPVADFISEADQALYAAKGAGRNQVQLSANA
jgi:diguanylate cyclase